jgi:hypothetical protein
MTKRKRKERKDRKKIKIKISLSKFIVIQHQSHRMSFYYLSVNKSFTQHCTARILNSTIFLLQQTSFLSSAFHDRNALLDYRELYKQGY